MPAITPKYRRLTLAELQELEMEFVEFLIINGIEAHEWEKLKGQAPEKAEDVISLFSDVIFEGILRKVKFLDHRSPNEIHAFQCLENKIVLVGIKSENPLVDFTNESLFNEIKQQPLKDIKVFTTSKPYIEDRQAELFEMIQSGCQISDGQLFKTISLAL